MEVWSLLQCFWNQSVVHSCYLDCFAETGPKYLPDISLKHLTKLLIVKLFVISEFENVEMLNVCKYMLWYEQMIMFKGLYSNFTWPWLINRSVVNGDQTEEDKRRSVEVCSLQASALIFVLKWPGIARKLWLPRRLAQLHPLLHQLALHEQMDTKTLRGGNAEMSHVFVCMIPLFKKKKNLFHKMLQIRNEVFTKNSNPFVCVFLFCFVFGCMT